MLETYNSTKPAVRKVQFSDLGSVDRNDELREMRADACIVAVGAGHPHLTSLRYWHSVEVDMTAAMARLCGAMGARYISLLSSVDSVGADGSEPFSEDEFRKAGDDTPLGWWGLLKRYSRMKGQAERAVASGGIPSVRVFRSSNIVTENIRYGWLDWTLFKVLPYVDPLIPERFHSVKVRTLGEAMAGDAAEVLSRVDAPMGVTPLLYGDYMRIAGEQFGSMVDDDEREGSSKEPDGRGSGGGSREQSDESREL